MTRQLDVDFFREWRKRHALTEAAAAELLGVDHRTVDRYEAGKTALPSAIRIMCEAVDSQALTGDDARGYVWRIERYDGTRRTLFREVPRTDLDLFEVTQLLACLSARHLSDEEIIEATLGENVLLEWRREDGGTRVAFTAGKDPRYVVRLGHRDETP
jgi:transcriptional regulator with XRE-family HTH domain